MYRLDSCVRARGCPPLGPGYTCVGSVFREDSFNAYSRHHDVLHRSSGDVSCRSNGKDDDAQRRLEDVMSKAQALREQYSELMRQASDIQVGGTEDGMKVREELFKMAIEELETVLGVSEDIPPSLGGGSVVEELAGMIERGEDLPPPPEGMFEDEEVESAESFLSRIESGKRLFKDVVDGKVKLGCLLDGNDSNDFENSLLSENPEAKSRHAPDIPQEIMDMYTFGERVLYIVRRGGKLGASARAIELLDSYDLFADDFVLETNWFQIQGVEDTLNYCNGMDQVASKVQCSNLLMTFPDFSDDCEFVAEGTCDMTVSIPVPHWYSLYCWQAGKDVNKMGGHEQAKQELNLPHVLFPYSKDPRFGERPSFDTAKESMKFNKGATGIPTEKASEIARFLGPLSKGLLSDSDWISPPCDTARDNSSMRTRDPSEIESIDDFTPDDAEMLLRGLFGDAFDDAMEQVPDKLEVPENIEEEYQCFFENDPSTIHVALSWVYEVDLERKKVSRVRVIWNWANTGAVHPEDISHVVALECNHVPYALTKVCKS